MSAGVQTINAPDQTLWFVHLQMVQLCTEKKIVYIISCINEKLIK